MIILEDVTKAVGKREFLSGARARLPSNRRIAVLGPSAEEKKVFIDLLGGAVMPTAGRIIRRTRVGLPPGHVGGFTADLPVRLNVAHVARLYGADIDAIVDFVAEVSDLGDDFEKPYGALSGIKKRYLIDVLAFSIPFDVYLVRDDLLRANGRWYNKNLHSLFEARAKTSGMVIALQDEAFARQFCDMGLVLVDGGVRVFKDIEQAITFSRSAITVEKKEKFEKRNARRKERDRLHAIKEDD